mgnify:CR=1 FL=1
MIGEIGGDGASIELENNEYQLIKKLALWCMPVSPCWRSGPHLLDLLDSVPDEVSLPVPTSRDVSEPLKVGV